MGMPGREQVKRFQMSGSFAAQDRTRSSGSFHSAPGLDGIEEQVRERFRDGGPRRWPVKHQRERSKIGKRTILGM